MCVSPRRNREEAGGIGRNRSHPNHSHPERETVCVNNLGLEREREEDKAQGAEDYGTQTTLPLMTERAGHDLRERTKRKERAVAKRIRSHPNSSHQVHTRV